MTSLALVGVLATLGTLRQENARFDAEHDQRLRDLQEQIRVLESPDSWRTGDQEVSSWSEGRFDLIRIGDQVYIYEHNSVDEIRGLGTVPSYPSSGERHLYQSDSLDPAPSLDPATP